MKSGVLVLSVVIVGFLVVCGPAFSQVVVRYTIMKGETSVSNVVTARMEVEEERSKALRLKVLIPESKLLSLYEGEPEPILKIMLTVWDD